MTPAVDVVVTGIGMVTPVGLSAQASCAALRAGISRREEIETYMVSGESLEKVPAVGGRVPTEWFEGGPIPEEWPGHERFDVRPPAPATWLVSPGVERVVELTGPAAREAWLDAVLSTDSAGPIGLYLGLDEDEEAGPVIEAVRRMVRAPLEPQVEAAAGRAAGIAAVAFALADLKAGKVQVALVGGADSLIRGPVLARLDAAGVLRSATSPEGIIPGEAAAFFVLETARGAAGRGASPRARLLSVAVADEPTAGTDKPNDASGLTRALHQARRDSGGLVSPPLIVCDLNGDRYRALEWALASTRALGNLHGDMDLWHPADCIGDCGAASGPLNIVWVVVAFQKGYARSNRGLVWGTSDGSVRGAVVLAPPQVN